MAKTRKGMKEFLIGAMVGGVIGMTAVTLSRPGQKKSGKHLLDSVGHIGKALSAAGNENNLAEIIDWTAEGVQLWNKLKKGR
jgi:gas vesicle protein